MTKFSPYSCGVNWEIMCKQITPAPRSKVWGDQSTGRKSLGQWSGRLPRQASGRSGGLLRHSLSKQKTWVVQRQKCQIQLKPEMCELDWKQDKPRVKQELFMLCWEQTWFRLDPEGHRPRSDFLSTAPSRQWGQIFNFKDYSFFG